MQREVLLANYKEISEHLKESGDDDETSDVTEEEDASLEDIEDDSSEDFESDVDEEVTDEIGEEDLKDQADNF